MTGDPIMATLHLLVATNGRIRDSYRYRDELSGQLIREMQRTGRKDIVGYGHRARLVPHKPTGSPSERRRWRRVYGPTAYDLKITKLEAKAA